MAVKQLVMNVWEWIKNKWKIGRKISAVETIFAKRKDMASIAGDDLELRDI